MISKGTRCVLSGLVFALVVACTAAPGSGSNGGGNTSSSGGLTLEPGVYVATNGNDAGPGTNKTAPVKTIQTAIMKAVSFGLNNVFVTAGVYTNGNGLNDNSSLTNAGVWITNNNIRLIGGFDNLFLSRSGKSELDGHGQLQHIILLGNHNDPISNINIDGFVLRGGSAASQITCGGGIYGFLVSSSMISNCIVSNNFASSWGGGVCFEQSFYNRIYADVIGNTCASSGGGMFIMSGQYNIYNCRVIGNTASAIGGGIVFSTCSFETNLGSVISNSNWGDGGGIYLTYSASCFINSDIRHNISGGVAGGGGIFIDSGCNKIIIMGNIISNSAIAANSYGGGLFIRANNTLITNAVIRGNLAYSGGGIFLDAGVTNQRIFSDLSYNKSYYGSGGLFAYFSTNLYIDSIINSNSAGWQSGGIYMNGGYNTTIKGSLNGNTASNNAGAIEIYGSVNTLIYADMINNNALNNDGGALYTAYSTNIQVINSVMTNNGSRSYNCVILLGEHTGFIMISNCTIGSTNDGSFAIIEGYGDVTGQIIKNNKFLTNKMPYLYYENISGNIIGSGDDWTNINIAAFTGAAEASGNTMQ